MRQRLPRPRNDPGIFVQYCLTPRTRAAREDDVRSAGVLDLAARSGCTAYDCEFIYLAEQMGHTTYNLRRKIVDAVSLYCGRDGGVHFVIAET